ncbi:maltoporin [Acinetobacter sp. ANC 4558]|uniref:maltoporin n=1 Tax=Acinetobacter sp. ANC 4558 TaxID=1977876 RepID=UPI000B6A571E|nr:carbohydrate porin [Acinetobacter sp. ANC 4558]OTG86319.1 maltoporin [Acinetobacter sp. ANC 4558]
MEFYKRSIVFMALTFPFTIVNAFDFSGYLRAGVGYSEKGGTQSCFNLDDAYSKYRLGNECEQYAEFTGIQNLYKFKDESELAIKGTLAFYQDFGDKKNFSGDNYTRLVESYIMWNNISYLNGANIWAGRRFYNRHDIHISDFYYWDQSATGFGIDNFKYKDLYYSYVFSRKDNIFQEKLINRHDITISGFNTNYNGSLSVGASYIPKVDGPNRHSGASLSVQHKQKIGQFNNTLALQYGYGAGTGLSYTGDIALSHIDKSFRIVEYIDGQITENLSAQAEVIYQKDYRENAEDKQSWYSVGVRPVYAINDQFKLITEIGLDALKKDKTAMLTKLTIAPAWSPNGKGFWDRPEIRLYYTYAIWNKQAQLQADLNNPGSTLSSTGNFDRARKGSNFGVQIEYWWD